MGTRTRILACEFSKSVVQPGERITLSVGASGSFPGIYAGVSYRLAEHLRPPGLGWNPEEHVAYVAENGGIFLHNGGPLDTNPDPCKMTVALDTTGWQPWLYYFRVVLSASGQEAGSALDFTLPQGQNHVLERLDSRHLWIKIRGPEDHLDVTVSESRYLSEGTHATRVCRVSTGTILHNDRFSVDGGETWHEYGRHVYGWGELANGKTTAIAGAPQPMESRAGWFETELLEWDHGRHTVSSRPSLFHVPQAKSAMGHAPHKGPLYMGSIVERNDGALVALMAGWFVGDDDICPYGSGRPYSRTYLCESLDGGAQWRYLTTIGYDRIGSEGYNEGSLRKLPGGDFIVIMRTGSMVSDVTQDNPIMMSRSKDEGRTWAEPWRTGAHGAFPHLLVLSDGMLALSSGRPGAYIMFSDDCGLTWTDRTVIDATPYSGYTSLAELSPGVLLAVFGAKGYVNPENGDKSNQIRLAEICYRGTGAWGR
jgi:hypothetical protein